MTKVEAKAPTTTAAGNKEYYVCGTCDKLFLDEAGTQPTTLKDVTLEQLKPETPPVVEPDEPEVPDVPETPDEPEVPDVPETPVKPEEPVYVPETKVEEQVKDEAGKLTEMIQKEETVETVVEKGIISVETLEKVQEAIANSKEIITELIIENKKEVEIEKTAKELVETAVKEFVKETVSKIAQYLDIKVVLKTEETKEELGTLNKLTEEVTLTFEIPNEWKKEGRKFNVVRVHEGKTDVLDVWENGDGTVSFKTDRFSTYALIYTDPVVEEEPAPTPDVPETPDTPQTPPPTGDNNMMQAYILVLLLGLAIAIVGVKVSKRKVNE